MSTVTTRENVRLVTFEQVRAQGLSLNEVIRSISGRATSSTDNTTQTIGYSVPAGVKSATPRKRVQTGAAAVELLKKKAYQALAKSTARISADFHAPLANALTELANAKSAEQAVASRERVEAIIEHGKQQLIATSVAQAVENACRQIGFQQVTLQSRVGLQPLTLVAADAEGRSIVSEIDVFGQSVSLKSEIVGVEDGSCVGIMDRLDEALEKSGIRSSAPHREETGGVCRLASAQRLLNSKLRKSSGSGSERTQNRRRRSNARSQASTTRR